MPYLLSKIGVFIKASMFWTVVTAIYGGSIFLLGFMVYSGASWAWQYTVDKMARAELSEQFPLTHDKYIDTIVGSSHFLNITCTDSYGVGEYSKNKLYVQALDADGVTNDYRFPFDVEFNANANHRFEPNSNPNRCGPFDTKTLTDLISAGTLRTQTECRRIESAIKLLDEFIPPNDDRDVYSNHSGEDYKFQRTYEAICFFKVLETNPCIKKEHLAPTKGSLGYEELRDVAIGAQSFEYYMCDHPQHQQFLNEVNARRNLEIND